MQLTLEQVATRLGKSQRQVIYMIQQGRLKAEKVAGRWFVDSDAVQPLLNANQQRSQENKQHRLQAAVEQALNLDPSESRPRYSIRNLKAFQIALPLYRKACQEWGAEQPVPQLLRRTLDHLSQGCHRYDHDDKATAYRAARDTASLAICELALTGSEVADQLLTMLEQEFMAAMAGLMRRVDQPHRSR